ncbi:MULTISPECIES: KAP family P-loop NTPase fold protein [unclassified Psychrobacter]|uniref:KAP family P-loop NTPase fold protein n=1 Tax=unclassified Psychrobacter TaxID=196806 RepID=UPI001C608663|nr:MULTISPECIES: KAP family NTPase [unclassified Psychrobacter]|tara:strand:- start:1231 stop:2589 length:1359 start_codon:yes stop_codon:yes gene_type:complete
MDMDITAKTFDERDEFQRKSIAEKAIKLLKSDIDISPMVIDGSWGTGKTEFCHKLINLMKEDETHSIIYIDAFKADHINEPLMTVLAEIIKILPNEPARKKFIKKILPAVRFGIKALAKASVSHLLRQDFTDVAEDFTDEIEEATDKAIDATAELILKEHIEAEKNLKTLQAALTEIASNSPIVIFVDELDRCRPSFAIDTLEIIKHTFDVENVSFVLITNTQQLKASINHCYGQAVDAQRYLDKFVKFRFELSPKFERNSNLPILAASNHFFKLAEDKNCLPNKYLVSSYFRKAIDHLIQHQDLSLREIETLVLHMQIVQTLSNAETFTNQTYIGGILLRLIGVMLVCYRPELIIQIKKGTIDAKLLGEFLGVEKTPFLEEGGSTRPEVFEFVMAILAKDCNKNIEDYRVSVEQERKWDSYIRHYEFMDGMPHDKRAIAQIIKTANIMAFE